MGRVIIILFPLFSHAQILVQGSSDYFSINDSLKVKARTHFGVTPEYLYLNGDHEFAFKISYYKLSNKGLIAIADYGLLKSMINITESLLRIDIYTGGYEHIKIEYILTNVKFFQ